MGSYCNAQVCTNGHVITSDTSFGTESNFCQKCGASTITQCPSCSSPIRGTYLVPGVTILGQEYRVPAYCYNCGNPYPWTKSALEAMSEIIWEDEDLFDDEKKRISQSLPDLITDNPKTDLAVVRVKKYAMRATPAMCKALLSILAEHACERALQALGL